MIGDLAHDALAAVVYRTDQVVLLFGHDEAGLSRAREAAVMAGCRVAAEVDFRTDPDRLDRQIRTDAAVVVADEPSAELERLLARLQVEARTRAMRIVIVASAAMIDTVAALAHDDAIDHLVEPLREELVIAIALAAAPRRAQLHDISRRNGVGVLQQLSEEAARMANVLASLSEGELAAPAADAAEQGSAHGEEIGAGFVRSIIRARRLRDQYFRGELFADPAFDMLLDLFAARLEGNRVAVSSLCIAAAVPATTALRWIKTLTDRGLFVRRADPQDGRRIYIELSDDAARAMTNYLAAARRIVPLPL